jgi:hypothetical protein
VVVVSVHIGTHKPGETSYSCRENRTTQHFHMAQTTTSPHLVRLGGRCRGRCCLLRCWRRLLRSRCCLGLGGCQQLLQLGGGGVLPGHLAGLRQHIIGTDISMRRLNLEQHACWTVTLA